MGARACNERLALMMPIDDGAPIVPPVTPLERSLADVWASSAAPLAVVDRHDLRRGVQEMLGSWVWELTNIAQNRISDPVDYVEMRRKTFGSDLTMGLSRLKHGKVLPAEVFTTRAVQGLDNCASDYCCFANDIISYQKEIEFEGEPNNMVLVVQNFLDCDRPHAVAIVNDLMTARMKQFEHLVADEIPAIRDEFHLDGAAGEAVDAYVEELQYWMAGVVKWHLSVCRYTEATLRTRQAPVPWPSDAMALDGMARNLTGLFNSAATLLAQIPQLVPALQGAGSLPTGSLGADRLQAAQALQPIDQIAAGVQMAIKGLGQPALHLAPQVALDEQAPQVEKSILDDHGR
jgi:hypothetical protein